VFSTKWQTSQPRYGIVVDKDVKIPLSNGLRLDCDVYRPDAPGKFPVILGVSPYSKLDNARALLPGAMTGERAHMEAGDVNFYVRRGYVHILLNVRGTGQSDGLWDHMADELVADVVEALDWIAAQPWSSGSVATFGASYFAMLAKKLALRAPKALKTIFAPFGLLDSYRQLFYNGGILNKDFLVFWIPTVDNARLAYDPVRELGAEAYAARVRALLADEEIGSHPALAYALEHPQEGRNAFIAEVLLHPLADAWWQAKEVDLRGKDTTLPAYFGGCWGMGPLHLPGDMESFVRWQGPKKLTIGPPFYLDRPLYQYQYESLRWFDYWLKGVDTGIMDEPPIKLFVQNTGEWKEAYEWPLPETKWTEFYLHNNGLLSEHEFWPHDDTTTFVDWEEDPGEALFLTPPLVENTEVCGPLVLQLYASTTDQEVLWFVHFLEVRADGRERILGRGWLRGSQRRLDEERSLPWLPYHSHDRREPLTPGEVYSFTIPITPTCCLLQAGSRFGVRIKCTDRGEKVRNFVDQHGIGRIWRKGPAQIHVRHSARYPSHLLVPITRGNVVGTFLSGGEIMVR
jgi:predicted acyl esterase